MVLEKPRAPRVHCENAAAAGTSSIGDILHKKPAAAAAPIGGARTVHRGKAATGSVVGDRLHKKVSIIGEVPTLHRGKTAATVGSIGSTLEIVQKKAAAAESNSNGGLPTAHPRKVSQKKAAPGGSVGGLPATHPSRGAAFTASSGKMPQKKATSSPHGGKEATSRLRCSGTAAIKDIGSVSRSNIPQKKLHKVDKADTGLSGGGMLRKKSSKLEADTRRVAEELQDAKLLIQELNKLGRGEDISREDFLRYYDQLPSGPPWIDTRVELEYGKLNEQQLLHALYRFRYCKHQLSQKVCKKELEEDCPLYRLAGGSGRLKEDDLQEITEEGCSVEFRKEQGYFKHFEEDGTLDWCFHPDYLDCDALNDYQRLVLRNYGDTEYARWSEYHKYLHTYTIEQEYVKYCDVLSKELEWMKDYIHFDRPSFKWDHISSRGALQAVKIAATRFTKISATLAYSGYYECIESISYHHVWFEELDGVYFQIWLRVTQGLSFKDALAEVHHLNMFPLRQYMMKHALEFDYSMEKMEEQYRTCTASIISEVEEDQALKLIGEAVKKLFNKPKSYEQYIRKKIHIASVIGIPLVV